MDALPFLCCGADTIAQAPVTQKRIVAYEIPAMGGPLGVRSALRLLQQNMLHIVCRTPQKLCALFTSSGGLLEVPFLILDEVDQLIARNLHEFVFNIVKLLPPPRSRPRPLGPSTPNATPGSMSQASFSSFEPGGTPPLASPFQNQPRRFSGMAPSPIPAPNEATSPSQPI